MAKELRQNPQYKAKTEIDKKKKSKKDTKHKGKMEEATINLFAMYKDEKHGKQVYDVLDKNEKLAFKTKDYDKAKDYRKQNFDKLKELKEDEATPQICIGMEKRKPNLVATG